MPVPRLFPALTLLLLSGLALASPPGRSVVVAFGESLEPYVIPQLEAGIELDIIRAALKAQRYEMQPVFLSQKRLPQALADRRIDAHETGNQIDQNRLLYRGSVDVVVADYRIFNYMNKRMQADFNEQALPVTYHDIFIKLPYRVLFRQPALRDAFNQGLKQIQQNGDYQRILKRYS